MALLRQGAFKLLHSITYSEHELALTCATLLVVAEHSFTQPILQVSCGLTMTILQHQETLTTLDHSDTGCALFTSARCSFNQQWSGTHCSTSSSRKFSVLRDDACALMPLAANQPLAFARGHHVIDDRHDN